jgi:hypothetical protein
MNTRNGRIVSRESQRYPGRRQKAPRRDWSLAMEETSAEEIGDREVTANEGLVYAALRVWELKHGFGD